MKENCIVTSIQNSQITVSPLSLEACASCTADCSHKGTEFTVINPHRLEVKVGSVVKIDTSRKAQALQGIVSLLIPFVAAVTLWFCAPFIAGIFGISASEGWKAACTLTGLFVSAALVLLVTRTHPLPGIPQIVELVQ